MAFPPRSLTAHCTGCPISKVKSRGSSLLLSSCWHEEAIPCLSDSSPIVTWLSLAASSPRRPRPPCAGSNPDGQKESFLRGGSVPASPRQLSFMFCYSSILAVNFVSLQNIIRELFKSLNQTMNAISMGFYRNENGIYSSISIIH